MKKGRHAVTKVLTEKQLRDGAATRRVKSLLSGLANPEPVIFMEDVIFEIREKEAMELAFYRLCFSKLFGGSIGRAITTIFK